MYALNHAAMYAHIHCGNYKAAKAELEELVALANEKGAPFWKALATINEGLLLAVDGNESDAIKVFTSGMAAYQSTGATLYRPQHLSYLASAYAEVSQFEEAWRCISEAMTAVETTKESWYEAESIVWQANLPSLCQSRMKQKRKRISSASSQSRVPSKQNPGNSALQ
jgi:tetratricopeptide (TPR) repeat protein